MKVGIIGRQSAGRSTFFDALTGQGGAPRTPGKLRLGTAKVLDPRVATLAGICKPKSVVHAEMSLALPPANPTGLMDVAALRELRELKAYAHVIGAYIGEPTDELVPAEIAALNTEFILADMDRVERRGQKIQKGGGARPGEEVLLKQAGEILEREEPLRLRSWDEAQTMLLDELGVISHRPLLTVVNVSEGDVAQGASSAIVTTAKRVGSPVMWLCATLEAEIAALEGDAQREFLEAYGLDRPVGQRFVQAALDLLQQICFFTVGPDEVRAWTVARHSNAKRAARAIHSDLEKGFIRAEVMDYSAFVEHGTEAKCRSLGLLRTEGKDYEVKDGDILTIRFNV